MTDLLMTCGRCGTDVNIHVEHAVLRVNTTPEPKGELLFLCPRCDLPDVQTLGARLMALLLQVGAQHDSCYQRAEERNGAERRQHRAAGVGAGFVERLEPEAARCAFELRLARTHGT